MKIAAIPIFICFVSAVLGQRTRAEVNDEGRLVESLLKGYANRGSGLARPLSNSSHLLTIQVKTILTEFLGIDDEARKMEFTGILRAKWTDEYLKWNPEEFGNITATPLQSNDIYLPVIMRSSSSAEISPVFSRDADTQSMIWLDYRGTVHAAVAGVFTTDCNMDLLAFPFDTQTCEYVFQVWQHSSEQIVLTFSDDAPFELDSSASSEQAMWSIEGMEAEIRSVELEVANFSAVAYKIHCRRRSSFYTFSLIIPCALMSAVILAIFFMPYDGQRVYFAITLVWTLRLFHTSISHKVPVTNEPIQILKVGIVFIFQSLPLISLFFS